MPLTLQQFREQNPAYADPEKWSDQKLADGLYRKFYADKGVDQLDFYQKIGYQPPAEPAANVLGARANEIKAKETQGIVPDIAPQPQMNYAPGQEPPAMSTGPEQPGVLEQIPTQHSALGALKNTLQTSPTRLAQAANGAMLAITTKALENERAFPPGSRERQILENAAANGIERGYKINEDLAHRVLKFNKQPVVSTLYDIASAAEDMGPALGGAAILGPAAGSTAVTLSLMGGQVFGQAYMQRQQAGESPDEAFKGALVSAGIETLTELIPIHILFQAGKPALKKVLELTVGAGASESVSSLLQDAYDAGTIKPDMTLEQALKNAGYQGVVGAGTGLALGGGAAVVEQTAQGRMPAITKGQKAGRALQDLVDSGQVRPEVAEQIAVEVQQPPQPGEMAPTGHMQGERVGPGAGLNHRVPTAEEGQTAREADAAKTKTAEEEQAWKDYDEWRVAAQKLETPEQTAAAVTESKKQAETERSYSERPETIMESAFAAALERRAKVEEAGGSLLPEEPNASKSDDEGPPTNERGLIPAYHYSRITDLTSLDPSKYGTGIAGAEMRRKLNNPKTWQDRTYFYLGDQHVRELSLGPQQYRAELEPETLYDLDRDPENFYAKAKEEYGAPNPTLMEKLIKDAGYAGYWTKHPSLGYTAALFRPTKVAQTLNGARLNRAIDTDGGFTVDPNTGEVPTSGYGLGIGRGQEYKSTPSTKEIEAYIQKNADVLYQPGHYLGGWKDKDGTVFLDVTRIYPNTPEGKAEATRKGKELGERAGWDFEKGEEFRLDEGSDVEEPNAIRTSGKHRKMPLVKSNTEAKVKIAPLSDVFSAPGSEQQNAAPTGPASGLVNASPFTDSLAQLTEANPNNGHGILRNMNEYQRTIVHRAMADLESLGFPDGAYMSVGGIMMTSNNVLGQQSTVNPKKGDHSYVALGTQVVFDSGVSKRDEEIRLVVSTTLAHEVGHSVDVGHVNEGDLPIYWSTGSPGFELYTGNGLIVPQGPIISELYNVYREDREGLNGYLKYPFATLNDPLQVAQMLADLGRYTTESFFQKEAFAQLFSIYYTLGATPEGRAALERIMPRSMKFMDGIHDALEQSTDVTERDRRVREAFRNPSSVSGAVGLRRTGAGAESGPNRSPRLETGSVQTQGPSEAGRGSAAGGAELLEQPNAAKRSLLEQIQEETPRIKSLVPYLTPAERAKVKRSTVGKLLDIFEQLPDPREMASVAYAGKGKRGWYQKSAQAIYDVFGADAPRFAALLAALSPQTSVENNLINALNVWNNWVNAGRPTDGRTIIQVMGQSVQGSKGVDSVLDAWKNNSIRALTHAAPDTITLSGPKVNSFMLNLRGVVNEVTNDAWMANYAGIDQTLFAGTGFNEGKAEPGKGPGYLAMNVAVRKAARILSARTGETWTPAEIQETIWSWAKTLYEMRDAAGEARTAPELVPQVTDQAVQETPDFAYLFTHDIYTKLLELGGYHEGIARIAERSRLTGGNASERTPGAEGPGIAPGTYSRHLEQAAARLEQLYQTRRAEKRTGGNESLLEETPNAAPVYHASPHLFDKFSLEKIGTGEGAQAYGHGLYFAQDEGTGKSYFNYFSNLTSRGDTGAKGIVERLRQDAGATDEQIVKELIKRRDAKHVTDPLFKQRMNDAIEYVKSGGQAAHLYEVDIPDSAISKMLDWDKPLSEQSENVRKVLSNIGIRNDMTGADVYRAISGTVGRLWKKNTGEGIVPGISGEQAASEYLKSIGIPGIKYLDQASRSAGEGTRNIVLFDEKLAKIISRNGTPLNDALLEETPNALPNLQTAQRDTKKFVRRYFTKEGLLGKGVFEKKLESDAMKNVGELDTAYYVTKLEQAATAAYNKRLYGSIAPADLDAMHRYLVGENVTVPADVRPALDAMRAHLDGLSYKMLDAIREMLQIENDAMTPAQQQAFMQFLQTGQGEPPAPVAKHFYMYQTIGGNVGTYLNRSYQAFDDPGWMDKVQQDPTIIDNATTFIQQQNPNLTVDEARGEVMAILQEAKDKGSFIGMFSRGAKAGRKDVSFLKRRKDVPLEIRQLLGEYRDPRLNFVKSATKMQWYLANHHFLMGVRRAGLGTFLFDRPIGNFVVRLATENNEAWNPLDGLYTSEDFRQGLVDAADQYKGSDFMRALIRMNSAVKYGKTILAPTTQLRNFYSAAFFTVMNGHFNWSHMAKSFGAAKSDLFTHSAQWQSYLKKLIGLGVLHDNPYAGELRDALKDFTTMDLYSFSPTRGAKRVLDFMQRTYRVGDDFWKIIGWENEVQRQVHSGVPLAQAEKIAAQRIRDGYPTYSMVPKGVKMLRRAPLVGTFVSFPYEIVRTSYNQMRFLKEDMAAGNTPAAVARTIGMAISGAGAYAASELSMALMGLSDDEDEAVRAQLPPWSRNSQLLYVGYDENGAPMYMDMSYLDPYTYIKKPVSALLNGNNRGFMARVQDSLSEFLEPFIGVDIAAGTLIELVTNKKFSTGGQVYNPELPPAQKALAIADYLRNSLQPGVMSNLERTWKAIEGDASPSGKQYTLRDEGLAWIGFRFGTLNLPQSLIYKAYEFRDRKAQATGIVSRLAGSQSKVSDSELENAVQNMLRSREAAYQDMISLVNGARKLNMPDHEIRRSLKAAGMSRKDVAYVLRGEVPRWTMTSRFLKSATTRADVSAASQQRRDELTAEMRRRKQIIREIVNQEQ